MPTAVKIPTAPRWDLDSIFQGGSTSAEFASFRTKVSKSLHEARSKFDSLPRKLDDSISAAWIEFILLLQAMAEEIELIQSFAGCLTAQNVDDAEARAIEAEGDRYFSEWEQLKASLEAISLDQSDEDWDDLISTDELRPIRFFLDEMRHLARKKMSVQLESLALDLAVNGYHAWSRLYDKMAGDIRVDFEENGETTTISMGQVAMKMSSPKRAVRAQAFDKMTEGWTSRADLAAMTLNALAGFRLTLYKNREWDSPLYEPLTHSRLKQESLDAMWAVIARETPKLAPYIEAKKKLLGIDHFRWYDVLAPCGKTDRLYTYDEAARFIIDHVGEFSQEMADLCRTAIDRRWIEAEDRVGKAAGGWCAGLGPIREKRIFMTYAGTYENLLTLAHELGHAYHGHVLRKTPFFATDYPMTLAETASIFVEMLITDAALGASKEPQEKLMLLDQKLQQPYIMFCNLHCRYLFERAFYDERKSGVVSKDGLCELMVEAQKQAYGSLLDETGYHPLFWASKLHFYDTQSPFYNYPYTFGFLFAGGAYDYARKEGAAFADKYRALLADTGSMTTEECAKKHLGVDLTQEKFWEQAVSRALADVDEFVSLASGCG